MLDVMAWVAILKVEDGNVIYCLQALYSIKGDNMRIHAFYTFIYINMIINACYHNLKLLNK